MIRGGEYAIRPKAVIYLKCTDFRLGPIAAARQYKQAGHLLAE